MSAQRCHAVLALRRLLEPALFAPLLVIGGLLLLSGLFNVLYTCLHDAGECAAVHAHIGPVRSLSLQNSTELLLSLLGYAMIVLGLHGLYGLSRRGGERWLATFAVNLVLLVLGALLITTLYLSKTG